MKIGILTFHFGNNYGGILQCYALQQVISNMGHDVEVINYKPSPISRYRKIINKIKTIHSFKDLFKTTKDFINVNKGKSDRKIEDTIKSKISILKTFDNFRNEHLKLSQPVDEKSIGYLASKYDAIIVGSDQVWTSLFDKNPVYFLDWNPSFKGKRISYAACSAHNTVVKSRARDLKQMLSKFDAISVRDEHTAELIKSITENNPSIVSDPTLLYDFNEFIDLKETEPYILTYILGSEISGGHEIAIKKIKNKYGNIKVISIVIPGGPSNISKFSDKVYMNASPSEWMNLFANASFVYTDSFHGVMFSIKFQKQFISYYSNLIRASRLIDIKKRYNLHETIIDSATNIDIKDINYSKLLREVKNNILYSSVYLSNILQN